MSIERVLNKIVQHNDPILGCILLADGKAYNNLPEQYEMVDVVEVAEYAENIFELAGTLDTGPRGFDQLFLEFDEYSFFARALDEGVLVLLTTPIERSIFKKFQVGVNLFMKPLSRELSGRNKTVLSDVAETVAAVEEKSEAKRQGQRMYRGVRY